MDLFFKSLLLLLVSKDAGHFILAQNILPKRVLAPSVTAYQNPPTPDVSAPASNGSQTAASISTFGISSNTIINVPTPLPSPFQGSFIDSKNYQDIISGYCAIDDNYCSFEGSRGIGKSSTKVFDNQCLLWDASCSGNRTLAIDEFFNTTDGLLQGNSCFSQFSSGVLPGKPDISVPAVDPGTGMVSDNLVIPSDCKKYNPSERISDWQDIKSWMRSPGCVSAKNEWTKAGGKDPVMSSPSEVTPSCCGLCDVGVETVDIYYWPEPGANTSCLDIVGTSVNPFDYGATTGEAGAYWACSLKTPATSIYTYPGTKPGAAETITSVHTILTTAKVVTTGSLPVKIPQINPWSSSPCIDAGTSPQGLNSSESSVRLRARHAVRARDHTLITQPSTNNGTPVSTVVLGDLTLTSPSIYANFHGIEASDWCGQTTMTSTMLSFSPGELSTIEGPLGTDASKWGSLSTKQFDFRDLPCPPQSIMEANWYKPEPGEPYRPLVAMPAQLRQRVPWLSFCEDIVFRAYDPPTALSPATALGPSITSGSDPKTHTLATEPSPILEPGARKTLVSTKPVSVPMDALVTQKTLSSRTQSNRKEPSSVPKQESEFQQASDSGGDPIKQADPDASGLPLQPSLASTSNKSSDQNLNIVAYDEPNQTDKKNPAEDVSGKEAADVSRVTGPEAKAPAGISNDPQSILNTIAGHAITAAPAVVAIAGISLSPGDPGVTIGGTLVAQDKAGHLILGSKTIPIVSGRLVGTIITTIANEAIIADPTAIAIKSTTVRAGDPGIIIDGTLVALDSADRFLIGLKTTPFKSGLAAPIVTAIVSQIVKTAANGVTIAGTDLKPGDAGFPIDGTVMSLDTAGRFVLGSKTYSLGSESTADLDDVTVGASSTEGRSATVVPWVHQSNLSIGGDGNATNRSVQIFTGEARALTYNLRWTKIRVVITATTVFILCFGL